MTGIRKFLAFVLAVALSIGHCSSGPLYQKHNDHNKSVNRIRAPELTISWDYTDRTDYPEADAEMLFAELERRNLTKYVINKEKTYSTDDSNTTYRNLCASERRLKYYAIRGYNKESNDWFWILNPKSNQLQSYDIELCAPGTERQDQGIMMSANTRNPDQTCQLVDSFELGNFGKCVQEYIKRKIYYMSNDNKRILKTGITKIPSCCSCYIMSEY